MEVGDATAMFNLGYFYSKGARGLLRDHSKALELCHQAGELGCVEAMVILVVFIIKAMNVERDNKKAENYHELAAPR